LPSAGQYFVRVTGATADSVQLYDVALSVVAIPPLSGDYNHNNIVDTADYVEWRKNDGTQAGYVTWRANFGTPSSGSGNLLAASIPEPTSALLLVFAATSWCIRRGRTELRVRSTPTRLHNVGVTEVPRRESVGRIGLDAIVGGFFTAI